MASASSSLRFAFAAALAATLTGATASALPPGRDWTPLEVHRVPGHTWLAPNWLNTDSAGIPIASAEAVGGIGSELQALRWADSVWTVTWQAGFPAAFSWPILSPPGTSYLLWKGIEGVETPEGTKVYLVMTQFLEDQIGALDTLGLFHSGNFAYGATVSGRRRWAAISDYGNLRLFHSDAIRSWREVVVGGSGARGITAAADDDTTALLVWSSLDEGLRWGMIRGNSWKDEILDASDQLAGAPRLRPRPSGGHWLAWGTGADKHRNYLPIRTFRDGVWSPPESILCAGLPNGFWTGSPDLSRDDGEYPAVVWYATDATGTGRETICVCMPTDSGFTVADNLPYTGLPTIARDRNGDVWVAWWTYFDGMFWLHTFNRATAQDVRVETSSPGRRVAWTLSEPAPETWWAVLRAKGNHRFEPVARVRAGAGLDMNWTDASPPPGLARYKIRRESVDTRYGWESPAVQGTSLAQRPILRPAASTALARPGLIELENAAAGPLEVRLHDLQGRIVLHRRGVANDLGHATIDLDLAREVAPLRNGIYFAVAHDASGQTSQALKLVILK